MMSWYNKDKLCMEGEMNVMRKISKKLYIALAVLLCVGIALAVYMAHSDANEQKQGKSQNITTEAKQEKGESEEDSYNTNQIVSKEKEKNEKEGDYQEEGESKETVISDSPKEKTDKGTQDVPKHTHSWEPVYSVKTDYESVEIYGIRCNNCGYSTTVADDLYNHIDKDPFDQCGSYSTGVAIRTEQNAVETKYISGYKCSCGAEK